METNPIFCQLKENMKGFIIKLYNIYLLRDKLQKFTIIV